MMVSWSFTTGSSSNEGLFHSLWNRPYLIGSGNSSRMSALACSTKRS